jgi:hypothetical protein
MSSPFEGYRKSGRIRRIGWSILDLRARGRIGERSRIFQGAALFRFLTRWISTALSPPRFFLPELP